MKSFKILLQSNLYFKSGTVLSSHPLFRQIAVSCQSPENPERPLITVILTFQNGHLYKAVLQSPFTESQRVLTCFKQSLCKRKPFKYSGK